MKNTFLKLCFIGMVCMSVQFATQGQNLKEDFLKIHTTYAAMQDISIQANYSVYKDKNSSQPFYMQKGMAIKNGDKIYTKIGDRESIQTSEFNLSLDHKGKVIFIEKNLAQNMSEHPFLKHTDQIIGMNKEYKFTKVSSNEFSYLLKFPSNEYESLEIFFNPKNFMITKTIFYYKIKNENGGTPKLEIQYAYDTAVKADPELFKYTKFLSDNNGVLSCQSLYKEYKLINAYKKQ